MPSASIWQSAIIYPRCSPCVHGSSLAPAGTPPTMANINATAVMSRWDMTGESE